MLFSRKKLTSYGLTRIFHGMVVKEDTQLTKSIDQIAIFRQLKAGQIIVREFLQFCLHQK